jgi:SAM-dependent methyltransferase
MSVITDIQLRFLKAMYPGEPDVCSGTAYASKSKLRTLLGDNLLARVRGKTVIDFGCGAGNEAVEMALAGATRVIGLDIREPFLEEARRKAADAGVGDVCTFATTTHEPADVIVSIDSFEHFDDPATILRIMGSLLPPRGECLISFGPTWYHPLGGHLFSVFPWAHLVLSEEALVRWRATFKSDGARRFREVDGGLNQITIRQFERLVQASPFEFSSFETVPIRKLDRIHNRFTREFTTAIVRCSLAKRI